MNDERPPTPHEPEKTEPAFTPLGTPPAPPIRPRQGDIIHVGPELAVGEADVRAAEQGEIVIGTSLARDAWRRLLKNKLAVFGMIMVVVITLASIAGPFLIQKLTGFTPDYIPTDISLKITSTVYRARWVVFVVTPNGNGQSGTGSAGASS